MSCGQSGSSGSCGLTSDSGCVFMEFSDGFTVIPSIRKMKEFEKSLQTPSSYILLSEVHIGNLKSLSEQCRQHQKKVLVNLELIGGFSADKTGLKLLKDFYQVDAVISANAIKVNMAKALGFTTVQRFFLIDSRSFDSTLKSIQTTQNDAIEILPGPMAPHVFKTIRKIRDVPLIAGGFISTAAMVDKLNQAGFSAVTCSKPELWNATTK